jgi:hypothetical protein
MTNTPYRAGTTHVMLEPMDFHRALVALVHRPRVNLTPRPPPAPPGSCLPVAHAVRSDRLLDNTQAILRTSGTCSKRPGYGDISFSGW